jgi:hypothetical protein
LNEARDAALAKLDEAWGQPFSDAVLHELADHAGFVRRGDRDGEIVLRIVIHEGKARSATCNGAKIRVRVVKVLS